MNTVDGDSGRCAAAVRLNGLTIVTPFQAKHAACLRSEDTGTGPALAARMTARPELESMALDQVERGSEGRDLDRQHPHAVHPPADSLDSLGPRQTALRMSQRTVSRQLHRQQNAVRPMAKTISMAIFRPHRVSGALA